MQLAAEAARQLGEIVSLQDRVVEFEKAERLVALQPEPDAVLGQHAVYREMPTDIAQQRNVAEFVEPVGVVDHHRIARTVAELQEFHENLADAGHIVGDLGIVEELAGFVLAGRIADPRRPAAHQDDRLVPAALKQPQQHDADEAADMEAVRRAVKAVIGYNRAGAEPLVERLDVGTLMDEAALARSEEKGRARCRHGCVL